MVLAEEPAREESADDDGRLARRRDQSHRRAQHGGENEDVGKRGWSASLLVDVVFSYERGEQLEGSAGNTARIRRPAFEEVT